MHGIRFIVAWLINSSRIHPTSCAINFWYQKIPPYPHRNTQRTLNFSTDKSDTSQTHPMYIFSSSRTLFRSTCALQFNSLRYFANKMGLPRVFFEMAADGQSLGRIVIEVSRCWAYLSRKFANEKSSLEKLRKMCILRYFKMVVSRPKSEREVEG